MKVKTEAKFKFKVSSKLTCVGGECPNCHKGEFSMFLNPKFEENLESPLDTKYSLMCFCCFSKFERTLKELI